MTTSRITRDGPLAGVRVLDFTQWPAGPFATTLMGDMGADVIKIERLGVGHPTRLVDRVFAPGMSSYFVGVNRSKRSVAINLRKAGGRDLAAMLARSADVIVENFRPGVMRKLGLDYEDLRADNPSLVSCSISSFGQYGPLRDKTGMDLVA